MRWHPRSPHGPLGGTTQRAAALAHGPYTRAIRCGTGTRTMRQHTWSDHAAVHGPCIHLRTGHAYSCAEAHAKGPAAHSRHIARASHALPRRTRTDLVEDDQQLQLGHQRKVQQLLPLPAQLERDAAASARRADDEAIEKEPHPHEDDECGKGELQH